MSRRRGVVRSDDDEEPPAPSRRSDPRPSKPQGQSSAVGPAVGPAVADLPNLAVLANDRAQALREPDRFQQQLAKAAENAVNVISDSAVAVEDVSEENSGVPRLRVV